MELDWQKLLSKDRYNGETNLPTSDPVDRLYHVHQRDVDRVTFSSAFRRLQGKTQVFIFPETDYVRNRLTHTLEAASISRILATAIIRRLREIENYGFEDALNENDVEAKDVIDIVAAATYAHDIGNTPFGHIGEYAIRSWFKEKFVSNGSHNQLLKIKNTNQKDFVYFDGNPQAFRLITRLQGWPEEKGGLRLTCATLASSVKYPWFSNKIKTGSQEKKFGFFYSDKVAAERIFQNTGLFDSASKTSKFARHPLSFIVEAADDIAYITSDLEDGVKYGLLDYKVVLEFLRDMIPDERLPNAVVDKARDEPQERIKLLRSAAILTMCDACTETFITRYEDIMYNRFNRSLLEEGKLSKKEEEARELIRKNIYYNEFKVRKEAAAYHTVRNLLSEFSEVTEEIFETNNGVLNDKNMNLRRIIQPDFDYATEGRITDTFKRYASTEYEGYLRLIDFISGMTDSYARETHNCVSGKMPG